MLYHRAQFGSTQARRASEESALPLASASGLGGNFTHDDLDSKSTQKPERGHAPRGGAAATELALVLPLLILLALGCVDFGRYAYYSIAVQNAARTAAEYAIMNPYP